MSGSSKPCSYDGCLGKTPFAYVKYCSVHWDIKISDNIKAFAEAEKIKGSVNENTD
jgi:hypothetical protein